jgi:hypothetical protein
MLSQHSDPDFIPGLELSIAYYTEIVALSPEDTDAYFDLVDRWTTRRCHHSGSSGQAASSRAASRS